MAIFVPYLTEEAIERDAKALICDYERARRTVVMPPIPIDDIVEKHLKLSLEFGDTHRMFEVPRDPSGEPEILGAMFFDEGRVLIDESLDPDVNPSKAGRYRFTLAHEGGGHWRLHRAYSKTAEGQATRLPGTGPRSVVCSSIQGKERVEWQADFYASCLLMPRDLVFAAWRDMYGSPEPFVFVPHKHGALDYLRQRNGPQTVGDSTQKEFQSDCVQRFDEIARRFAPSFAVSSIAMRIRLEHLGLLIKDNSRRKFVSDDA